MCHKVKEEKEKERKVLEKLKENVERIRKHQTKELKYEPEEHFDGILV
jgi:hypothetical protein